MCLFPPEKARQKGGRKMKQKSKQLALCSVLGALAVVFLCMGGIVPLALYACPLLASLLLIPLREDCTSRLAWTWFGAVALLGLLLGPDKEAVLLFCCLGYYPLLQPKLNAIPSRLLRLGSKLLLFAAAMGGMYALLLVVFRLDSVTEEFAATGKLLLCLTAALGLVLFLLYDRIVQRFALLYRQRKKKNGR